MKKPIVIIGSGSALIYTVDIIESQGLYQIVGIIDSKAEIGSELFGYKVIGRQEDVLKLKEEYGFIGGCINLGDNYTRFKVVEEIESKFKRFEGVEGFEWEWINAIHSTAIIGSRVEIGKGLLIMSGVIINPGTKIGDFCHFYTGAIVEHNNTFKDYSSISANSSTGGHVKVNKFAAICMGCTLFDRVTIGEATVIGSGSVVTKDVDWYSVAYGSPAKFIKSRELGDKYLK